jgi:hypothetical protein
MNIVPKRCQKSARIVTNGRKVMNILARLAHKANRRSVRRSCKKCIIDRENEVLNTHFVNSRDIS